MTLSLTIHRPIHRSAQAVIRLTAVCGIITIGGCANSSPHDSSSGDCAKVSPAKYLAQAQVAFTGIMMAGPTTQIDGRTVLVSPAKVRVSHYEKGGGPEIVQVVTGVVSANTVNADGIQPRIGQRWRIYSPSKATPFDTSICAGSSPLH
jgi:hypothetical protein